MARVLIYLLFAFGEMALSQSLPVKIYSVENGLPAETAFPLMVDTKGLLWLGMFEGVCAFDGVTFTRFGRFENFPGDAREALEDSDGSLYFAGRAGLIKATRPTLFPLALQFRRILFEGRSPAAITALTRDPGGAFYAATSKALYEVRGDSLAGVDLLVSTGPAHEAARPDARRPPLDTRREFIIEAAFDSAGNIWVATSNSLYYGVRNSSDPLNRSFLLSPVVEAPPGTPFAAFSNLHVDALNRLWYLSSDNALRCVRYRSEPTVLPLRSVGIPACYDFSLARDNSLWMAGPHAIHHLLLAAEQPFPPAIRSVETLTASNGVPWPGWAINFVLDSLSNLWCYKGPVGLLRISLNGFVSYGGSDLGVSDLIDFSCVARDRIIVSGSAVASVVFDSSIRQDLPYRILTLGRAEAAHSGSVFVFRRSHVAADTLLAIAPDGISYVLPSSTEPPRLRRLRIFYRDAHCPRLVIPRDFTTALFLPGGICWVAGNGVYRCSLRGDSLTVLDHYSTEDGLADNTTKVIARTGDGDIWFGGFSGGLSRFDGRSFRTFTDADGLSGNSVRALYESRDGTLWIGTRYDGLCAYRGGRFRLYPDVRTLGSDEIWSITADSGGSLWIGTGQGVASFLPDSRLERQPDVRHFDQRDGLPRTSVTHIEIDGERTLAALSQGRLYLANLQRLERTAFEPSVYLTSVEVNSRERENKRDLHLSAEQNNVSFTYETIDLSGGSPRSCQYILEGLESQWSPPTFVRKITFGNVPPGSYTFRVRVARSDTAAASADRAETMGIDFSIASPFWRTWWFMALAACMVLGAGAMIVTSRVRHLLAVERLRGKIATDLHDDIGSNLSSIAIFSDLAEREIDEGSALAVNRLRAIAATARSLLDALNDIVWSIDPDNDTLEGGVLHMQDFAVRVLEAKGIEVSSSVHESLKGMCLPMDVRRHVDLMFKEMINNVTKHSSASRVTISFSSQRRAPGMRGNGLTLRVEDNGKGFDPDGVSTGNGLRNLRKRSEALSGRLQIQSAPGRGTRIEVFVPLKSPF